MHTIRYAYILLIGILFIASSSAITGCARSTAGTEVTTSGFLTGYSQLRKGVKDRAVMYYIDDKVDVSRYKKIIIDPVKLYVGEESDLAKAPAEDQKALVDYMYSRIREELGSNFKIVKKPGRDTIRLRLAVTDGDSTVVVADAISSFVPIGLAISGLKSAATDSHLAVGGAQIEGEIIDSVSGRRLAAVVDKRYGGKLPGLRAPSKWNSTRDALDAWAVRLGERLNKEFWVAEQKRWSKMEKEASS